MEIASKLLPRKRAENLSRPLAVMHTERILLRAWTREDVDSLHALWTQPEVRRYLWDDVAITRDTAEKMVESHLDTVNRHGIGYWALHILPPISLVGAPMAGFCGFRFSTDIAETLADRDAEAANTLLVVHNQKAQLGSVPHGLPMVFSTAAIN